MIDTHCHLIDPQFRRDLEFVLERAKKVGITKIINAGYDVATSQGVLELHRKEGWLYPAVGIHPNEAADESLKVMGYIEELLTDSKVIAIGETGLDYYRNVSSQESQLDLFQRHIKLAREYQLPLLIHTRNSIEDAINLLKKEDYHKGVFHCYSGTYEHAMTVIDMGFYLGFGGVLTFSKRLREIFKKLPVDRIVLETDAPFLAPANHRGTRNEPAYIMETLNTAAGVLEMGAERLEHIVDQNATALFSFEN